MGVTLNKTFVSSIGIPVQNAYVSIGGNNITKNLDVDGSMKYKISSCFKVWLSTDARENKFEPIGNIQVEVKSDTPPTGNIYEVLYNKLKSVHSCTDVI